VVSGSAVREREAMTDSLVGDHSVIAEVPQSLREKVEVLCAEIEAYCDYAVAAASDDGSMQDVAHELEAMHGIARMLTDLLKDHGITVVVDDDCRGFEVYG